MGTLFGPGPMGPLIDYEGGMAFSIRNICLLLPYLFHNPQGAIKGPAITSCGWNPPARLRGQADARYGCGLAWPTQCE